MFVPDFWPESLDTPEDRILTYTTPKESYIKALKRTLQSPTLGIPIRCLPLGAILWCDSQQGILCIICRDGNLPPGTVTAV